MVAGLGFVDISLITISCCLLLVTESGVAVVLAWSLSIVKFC